MRAPLEICRMRTVSAVLTTGVVVSLTALTGGVAPAFAAPGSPPGAPTTTVVPEPAAEAPVQAPAEKTTIAEVPSVAAPTPESVAPTAPSTVEAPAKPRATEPAPAVETPTQTRDAEPEPSAPAPVTTATRQAPTATSEAPSASRPAPSSTVPSSAAPSSLAPSSSTPARVTSTSAAAPSAVTTSDSPPPPPSPELVAPTSSASEPSSPESTGATPTSAEETTPSASSAESQRTSSTDETTSEASPTPGVIEKVAPKTLEAPEADVQIAQAAKIVEQKPLAAPKQEIDDISRVIDLPDREDRDRRQPFDGNDRDRRDRDQVRLAGNWDRNVRQWRPDWVRYDEYYRPVLSNPYRDPVRIVYIYQNAPRVVWIPPLARIVLEVAQFAAYSFTAVVQNTVQTVANVAVGSFFGGGYFPGVGLPLPPPPPPLLNFANVPVQVRYSDATYEPFRVSKIVDVGDDAQYGERKVLLDGVTPAWGQWKQTPSGERSFEVHKTQQFPGLDDPQEAPLPGDYQLRLASDESPSGMNKRDVYLIAVAVACGALSIGAVVLSVFIGRRRRPQH